MTRYHVAAAAALALHMLAVPFAGAQSRPAGNAAAETVVPPAGARDGDRTMTCADIAAERSAIDAAVAKRASEKAKSVKVKKGLFGFAKSIASVAVPGMMGGLGGTSMIGALATQSAGASASGAINAAQLPGTGATAASPSTDEQARLDRLAKVGALRQCNG